MYTPESQSETAFHDFLHQRVARCVTCRTANNLAAEDFRISFCRFLARTLSFSRMALNSLVCNRKRFLLNFFQGSFCQSSLKLISCLTMIYILDHFLITSRQLRLVLPEIKEFGVSSHLPGFSTFSQDLYFVFIRSDGAISRHL